MPGVEVAAPLAFLGYVRLPTPLISFSSTVLPPGYYRVNWTLMAFNGQHWLVEKQESLVFDVVPSCQALTSKAYQPLVHQGLLFSCGAGAQPTFPSLDTGTFLLAAIDPTAENRLIPLNKSLTEGRMLTGQDRLHSDPRNPSTSVIVGPGTPGPPEIATVPNKDLPVVLETQLPGQITLHAVFSHIAPTSLSLDQVQAAGGLPYLQHLPADTILFQGNVPLVQNDPQRFSQARLTWNGKTWQAEGYRQTSGSNLTFLYTPSGLTYQPLQALAGQNGPAYTLVPTGSEGPEATFRQLQPSSIGKDHRAFYFIEPLGKIAGSQLAAQFNNPLNWLSETTYAAPPVSARADATGRPAPATTLLPTTNTAGFLLQPPLALTTLPVAQQLLGDHAISALRLRVAGITEASPASWQKIQHLAQLIEERTGLHVFVTVGSSPQPVLVHIPGWGQQIASAGWVEERWIFSGAAVVYLEQLGLLRALLLVTILLVCLSYQIVTFTALASARRNEFAILSALGWRPWQPITRFLRQSLAIALTGGLLGILVALLIATLLGITVFWVVVWWTLPLMLVLGLVSVLYPLQQIWRIHPAEALRMDSRITANAEMKEPGILKHWLPPLLAFTVSSLFRSWVRALIVLLVLLLSTFLLTVVLGSLLSLRQELQGTLLGHEILLQTAVPQLAGCVFAILLTFFSLVDLLLLQVRERQREIGLLHALGWKPAFIQRLLWQESLLLGLAGAIPGTLLAFWLNTGTGKLFAWLIPIVILAALVLALLATLPAIRLARQANLSTVLRTA